MENRKAGENGESLVSKIEATHFELLTSQITSLTTAFKALTLAKSRSAMIEYSFQLLKLVVSDCDQCVLENFNYELSGHI